MNPFTVVIPARFASSRLPGKPLVDIGGIPMIQHVWTRSLEAGAAQVIVATDSAKVHDACVAFGADVRMTSSEHESGTDRINEVVSMLALDDEHVVVNVQGDEPLMPPENIRQVAELAAMPNTDVATLHVPVESLDDYLDPNVVKLVTDKEGRALYFSRAPIPWHRDARDDAGRPALFSGALRHLGIYAYRNGALRRFSNAGTCSLELTEKLEQLRALWLGMTVRTAVAARMPMRGVDTPEDLKTVRDLVAGRAAGGGF